MSMKEYHSVSQFNCLYKWRNTQSFAGTELSAVSWGAQRTCKRTVTIVPGHNLIWMLCLYSRQNKRPKVDSRREQQTLTIQFLTLLMSNSRVFLSFLKPQGFLHFLELCQGVGMHVGVNYKEHTLEANMVGPTKNCEMLSHTLPAPQHILLSLGFYSLQKYLVSWGS